MARVESKTWIVTPDKYETVTHTPEGIDPIMGHWMSPQNFSTELDDRFPGCMGGKRVVCTLLFHTGCSLSSGLIPDMRFAIRKLMALTSSELLFLFACGVI